MLNSAPTLSFPGAADPFIGQVFAGRFEIERLVATGGMGRVYLATQQPLGRPVALKILQLGPAMDADEDFRARFKMEAEVLGKLRHPHTVRVFDGGVHEGHPFIAMEYVNGPTLADVMRDGLMEPLRAIELLRQIAGALHEAHQSGITHRDLKPLNILLDQNGTQGDYAKVVDFGLIHVRGLDASKFKGKVLGTASYMAPEQIQAKSVDHRADIYALGVLFFALLTHDRPYEAKGSRAMLKAHVTQEPRSLASLGIQVPAVVEWTIRACLRKDPDTRIGDAVELVRALNACELAFRYPSFANLKLGLKDGCVVLPPEAAVRDGEFAGLLPGPDARKSRWLVAAVSAGLAGAILAAGVVWWARPPADVQTVEIPVPVPVMVETVVEAPMAPAPVVAPVAPAPVRPRPAAKAPVVPRGSDLKDPFADRR